MGITEQILADHALRKDGEGVSWFTVMQTVQHTLRLRKARQVVESEGCTDRWSLQDVH